MTASASSAKGSSGGRAAVIQFGAFAASTLAYQAGRFLFSLAAARALAPPDFAGWALVVTALVYAPSVLLGIPNGMSREVPRLLGADDVAGARRAEVAAWCATVLGAGAVIVAAAAVAAVGILADAILVLGILFAATLVYTTQQFSFRSRLRFGAASAQQATCGALMLVLAAVVAFGAVGGLADVTAFYAAPLVAAILVGTVAAPPRIVGAVPCEGRRLAAIGWPIMLAGLVFSVFVTVDRWIAASVLGTEAAAPYALASLLASAMLVIPSVVSQQTYPRMAMAHGRGVRMGALWGMAARQGVTATALVAPVGVALALFAWFGLPALLPEYRGAAPATVVLALGFGVLALFTGYGNLLNVVGRQRVYLGAQVAAAAIGVPAMLIGAVGWGSIGIAVGMAASHVAYGVLVRGAAHRAVSFLPKTRVS